MNANSLTQTTIAFAGINWNIKSGNYGPGPNNWSDSPSSVWIDENGYLHLKIRKVGNKWLCAKIYAQQSLEHGKYRFVLQIMWKIMIKTLLPVFLHMKLKIEK